MRDRTKLLLIIAILVLSVGPLSYFFHRAPQIDLTNDAGEPEPLFKEANANMTGKIIEMSQYISYIGIANTNEDDYVRSVMSKLNITNFSIGIALNPRGAGFQYSIAAYVENKSKMRETGFRLAYNFANFFVNGENNLPLVLGEIEVPDTFLASDGRTIDVDEPNATVEAILLYSHSEGQATDLYCPNVMITKGYTYIKTTKLCVDTDTGFRFGLSLFDYLFDRTEKSTEMTLEIVSISDYVFEGPIPAGSNITMESLQNYLTARGISIIETDTQLNQTNFTIKFSYENESSIQNVTAALAGINLTPVYAYKTALVELPEKMYFDENEYVLASRLAPVQAKINRVAGDQITASMIFSIKYSEIIEMSGQEI